MFLAIKQKPLNFSNYINYTHKLYIYITFYELMSTCMFLASIVKWVVRDQPNLVLLIMTKKSSPIMFCSPQHPKCEKTTNTFCQKHMMSCRCWHSYSVHRILHFEFFKILNISDYRL